MSKPVATIETLERTMVYASTGFEQYTRPLFNALEKAGMRPLFHRDPDNYVATAVYVPKRFKARFQAFKAGWDAAQDAARAG